MSNEIDKQPNAIQKFRDDTKAYFKGVKSEWGKITWPMRELVIADTGIVLFVVLLITAMVYVIDRIFIELFGYLHLIK